MKCLFAACSINRIILFSCRHPIPSIVSHPRFIFERQSDARFLEISERAAIRGMTNSMWYANQIIDNDIQSLKLLSESRAIRDLQQLAEKVLMCKVGTERDVSTLARGVNV